MENNKKKKWLIIAIVLVALAIIGNFLPKKAEPPKLPAWAVMTKDQKIEWRKNLLTTIEKDKYYFSYDIEEAVKKQTNFPLETEVNTREGLSAPQRASSEEPTIEWFGTGSTKNAFGVKVAFRWHAVAEFKPEGKKLLLVEVK